MILNHRKTIRSVISLPVLKIMFNNRIIHGMSAYPDKGDSVKIMAAEALRTVW